MNIAIISTQDIHGGAPRATYRLLKGLRLFNTCPVMMVRTKDSHDPSVVKVEINVPEFKLEQTIFWAIQHYAVVLNRSDRSNTFFTLSYPGYDISGTEFIQEADVVNLHWVAEFQSVETVAKLLELGKPVVWTLHDENPYTGGCHYTAGCSGYRNDCLDCPQLKDLHHQIPYHVLSNKLKNWRKNLTIVAPSRWLAGKARKSKVFQKFDVEVIPNAIEVDVFKPREKREAKKSLNIDPDTVCILFNAEYHSEKRKGFGKLLEALDFCLSKKDFIGLVSEGKIRLLTVGDPQQEIVRLGIPYQALGYLKSDGDLAKVYSAADVYVLPSLEDNLPNTMLEAMACGTPVVAFDVGGMPDMIKNGETGYVVPPFDSKRMGEAVVDLVFNAQKRTRMNTRCRHLIEQHYKLKDQAAAYFKLFEKLTAGKAKRSSYRDLVEKHRTVTLQTWKSPVNPGLLEVYRESVTHIIKPKDRELADKDRQLAEKEEILKGEEKILKKKEEVINEKEERLKAEGEALSAQERQLAERKEQLSRENRRLSQMDEQFKQQAAEMAEGQRQLTDKEAQLSQKEQRLQQEGEQLNKKASALEERTRQLAERENRNFQLEQQWKQKDKELQDKNRQLRESMHRAEKTAYQLQRTIDSRAYKIGTIVAHPLNLIGRIFRKARKKHEDL
jgi:glycosyltransferase involved in cell wall biosynthesis